jgi:hypothetical protein
MTAIHWPRWVVLEGDEDRAPDFVEDAEPPALLLPRFHRLLAVARVDGTEPPGAVGWIGNAPAFIDDGRGPESTPTAQHGKPRVWVRPEDDLEAARARAVAVIQARADAVIDAAVPPAAQRVLLVVHGRSRGVGPRAQRADAVLGWLEAVAVDAAERIERARAAASLAELQAVTLEPLATPAPHTLADVLAARA